MPGPIPKSDHYLFFKKVEPIPFSGCWIWMGGLFSHGYGQFNPKVSSQRYAHRWSWEHANGYIPKGMNVLHKCDVRCCVNPDHLFIGSQLDNVRDMDKKGRRVVSVKHGEAHHNAKISQKQVIEIMASEETNVSIAARFGVKPSAISKIRNCRTWKIMQSN